MVGMEKPDFESIKTLIGTIGYLDKTFDDIFAEGEEQQRRIKAACSKLAAEKAKDALDEISVEELKNSKAGIRVSALRDAGFTTLGQIARAPEDDIQDINGIGEKQIEALRRIVTEFANSLSSGVTIVLDENCPELITDIYRYIRGERVRNDARGSAESLKEYTKKVASAGIITNGFWWFFSGKKRKEKTIEMAGEMYDFCNGALFNRLLNVVDAYHLAITVSEQEAMNSFSINGAEFYAVLEKLGTTKGNRPFVYESIPQELAEEISDFRLNLDGFRGNLRAYQEFGAKYILNQRKVLLGDEMGLGKTIQAIAAMTHIHAENAGFCHILVVCPASVLINWSREVGKFSNISTYILHGADIDEVFGRWIEYGGVAITNYESMGKIVDRIDNRMLLQMLVIDEAHYIKNPDAKRTMYIRRLDNESERIVLMTGTPLENKVDEMCNLIDFVRPDMTAKVREMALLSHVPEFRETLAPVYLRRTREQVLKELPPIDEEYEWCEMTDEDSAFYSESIRKRSFQDMRRVGFQLDDLSKSAKAQRLLELCDEARAEGRKVVIYSYFRETISKVERFLGDKCVGVISGDTRVESRQDIVDRFGNSEGGSILLCQIIAGGVGLNIQAASMVIFCEPQVKPSLTSQALSRVYRMGQVRNVTVYHLLCPYSIDEAMMDILEEKQIEFDNFANESVVAGAFDNLMDKEWIQRVIEEESRKQANLII